MKTGLFEGFSQGRTFRELKALFPECNDQLIYRYGRLQKEGSRILKERLKKQLLEVK